MNLKEIKELIEMLKGTDISELEVERSGVKVRLRKGGGATSHPAAPRMETLHAAVVAPAPSDIPAPAAEKAVGPAATNQAVIISPSSGPFTVQPPRTIHRMRR